MAQYDMELDYSIGPNHDDISDDSERRLADFDVQVDQWSTVGRSTAERAESLFRQYRHSSCSVAQERLKDVKAV